MEITLEKIELVKDKTGVTYKEAKQALEKAEGDVVEAIIIIENQVNDEEDKFQGLAQNVIEKVKEVVKKGNVSKISVKKDDEVIANVPINAGIVGALIAPWGIVAAAVAAFGLKCKIEIVTEEGEIIDITEKVMDTASTVKEKTGVAIDYAKEKAPEAFKFAKEKGEEVINYAKEKAPEAFKYAKEKGEDAWEFAKKKYDEIKNQDDSVDLFSDEDLEDEMKDEEK